MTKKNKNEYERVRKVDKYTADDISHQWPSPVVKSALLILITSAVLILYLPTLNYPFQFDDKPNILQNSQIRLSHLDWEGIKSITSSTSGRNRPLSVLSFAINYYWGKYNPSGYRIINIIIHIINGWLIYSLLTYSLVLQSEAPKSPNQDQSPHSAPSHSNPDFLIPFFATAIWYFHPLATNSVIYIVQRMNSLAVMFYLISMVCYIEARMRVKSENWKKMLLFGGSCIAGLLALASKEIAATLPFMIVLYEWFFFQNLSRAWLNKKIPWILMIIVTILFIAISAFGFERLVRYLNLYKKLDFTMPQRVLTESRVVLFYLGLLIYPKPERLNIDHDFSVSVSLLNPVSTILSIGIIIGLIVLSGYIAVRQRIIAYGIFWYFINLVIESSIFPLDLIFEHRTYLPSGMLICIFVLSIFYLIKSRWTCFAILTACVLLLGSWTFERSKTWKSQFTLWQDCVEKSPGKSRPHVNLGEIYAAEGDFENAIVQYQKALSIKPNSEFAHYNLGTAYYSKKQIDKAIQHYSLALKCDPDMAEAHNNLGVALIDKKQVEEGIFHYKEALRLKPDHPEAPDNLKKAQTGLNQINARISGIEKQMQAGQENSELLYDLGYLYYRKGKFQLAEKYYKLSLSLEPNFLKAMTGLSILYAETNQTEEAIALLKLIIRLKPDDAGTYYNLACMYAREMNTNESLKWLREALDKGYNHWDLIKQDPDLEPIRATKAYQDFLPSVKN